MSIAGYKLVELKEEVNVDWCSLFNTYRFFSLHKTSNAYYFALIENTTGSIVAVCHLSETENNIFRSPLRGTFAGPELKENNPGILAAFMKGIEDRLKSKGAGKIILAPAPVNHATGFSSLLDTTLRNMGYTTYDSDTSFGLEVNSTDLSARMNRNNQRQLKKCLQNNFRFEQAFGEEECKHIYEVVAANRLHKGYQISMNWEQVKQMYNTFKDQMYFFKVVHHTDTVASAICMKINDTVLYAFYWGNLPGYEDYSPICLIADSIYKFARHQGFKLLDIGGATAYGVRLEGLVKFKENLGFTESAKRTYSKEL